MTIHARAQRSYWHTLVYGMICKNSGGNRKWLLVAACSGCQRYLDDDRDNCCAAQPVSLEAIRAQPVIHGVVFKCGSLRMKAMRPSDRFGLLPLRFLQLLADLLFFA